VVDAKRARELLEQVHLFDGEALPGVKWPATEAAVSWLATHLREALATIIASEEDVAGDIRRSLRSVMQQVAAEITPAERELFDRNRAIEERVRERRDG
jgi:hypothetical protein